MNKPHKYTRLRNTLAEREQNNQYRHPRITGSAQQPHMQIDGKPALAFCSNDYLGLANHPLITKAFQDAANEYGVGSGSAHLITGHSKPHQALEEALAAFTGRDRALLFSTGYMANLGVVSALMQRGDIVYQDKLNHASLLDAARLSDAKLLRYAHNDMTHLHQRIAKQASGQSMILADGVFSMDGDIAPVRELAAVAERNDSWLMIDDAHGMGVLGEHGAGLIEQEQLGQDDVHILMGTLGKGFGTSGAFVAGSHELIEYLIQTARTYIYTTAQPPAIAAATLASLKLVRSENWRREHLRDLIKQFRDGADQLSLTLMESQTPIQPIMVGDSGEALAMAKKLEQQGILVTAIRPPTVPANTARLRVTLSAAHTKEDVERLLAALGS
uniref:8-amino-7-oxononanoate synthase n=1 Tax=uncultured Thiotrichaceae bacterium TaxID=298394 RepID=A0A6S6U7P1_9GAMM|nr:MAG: 8-amino-7-oxononanoate synthase (EC [uncultured Thiotrichaceae bacterium]